MFRLAGVLALLVLMTLSCACTVDRLHHDANAGLDYARFSNGIQVHTQSRWQLATDTRIAVSEAAPAAHEDWITAARDGVGSVFGVYGLSRDDDMSTAELELLITWPATHLDPAPDAGYSKYLRVDKLVRGSEPIGVQVYLRDAQSHALIQSATLDLTSRWFSGDGSRGEHIAQAFRQYAQSLVSRY